MDLEADIGSSVSYEAHDKKTLPAPALRDEAPINEPDSDLTTWGVIKRGWFLFTFQSGKQLLCASVGALPLALFFALTICLPMMLPEAYADLWLIALLIFDVAYVLYCPIVFGALTCLASAAHCAEPISITTAYRRTMAHYGQLLLAVFGVYLGTLLGMYLLIVPGLWYMAKYGLAWIIVPLEKCGVSEAFRRSDALLKKRKTSFLIIFGLFMLMQAITVGVFLAVTLLWDAATESVAVKFIVLFLTMELLMMSVAPYIPVLTAFYYDCVRRKRIGDAAFQVHISE